MNTAGIICEYNPFHLGHLHHIKQTKEMLGGDAHIVCVMSGNYVQRGDVAVFRKHARAKMAVMCGADLVIELPSVYALSAAHIFAKAGVSLLESLGVCNYLSFGSESGDIRALDEAAEAIVTEEAEALVRRGLQKGLPYAKAQQIAADTLLGNTGHIFSTPNNTLAIEYIKAINEGSSMKPMTIKRTGGEHDSSFGWSASAIRKAYLHGGSIDACMPKAALAIADAEIAAGRGPNNLASYEQAMLSRLRLGIDFSQVPGAADGLDDRFSLFAPSAHSISSLLESVKTKRHAMSRIRRVLMCSVLGFISDDVLNPPPYLRVLAMNKRGTKILKNAEKCAKLPIITKPASVKMLDAQCVELFTKESKATDFYALGYESATERGGGSEWRLSPVVV